ncbi:MAG: membrane dipeptidase [Clostridia bacterium]|jgi:membrane dipeptidase|nr:membrane dipeptidase [Clostridia bacterium]
MIIVDGHCDTLLKLFKNKHSFWEYNEDRHLDWLRLKKGQVGLQFMSIYIEPQYKPFGSLSRVLEVLDYFHQQQREGYGFPLTVTSKKDLLDVNSSEPRVLLAIEGGEALEGKLSNLRILFKLGFRSLTLTWNQRNQIADGVWEKDTGGGLTNFGREVVKEMNSLGMLIDVSHLAERGFWEVLSLSTQPIAATHSSCYSLHQHPRNLTDAQLQALAKKQGIVGINFYPHFLGENPYNITIEDVLRHLIHAVEVAGIDHVGLGSDFDGIELTPQGLSDGTYLPCLANRLARLGWKDEEIKKVMGGNYLRVLQQILPEE